MQNNKTKWHVNTWAWRLVASHLSWLDGCLTGLEELELVIRLIVY
jgi:hypothetical protein